MVSIYFGNHHFDTSKLNTVPLMCAVENLNGVNLWMEEFVSSNELSPWPTPLSNQEYKLNLCVL